MAYHLRDGFYFERGPGSAVTIEVEFVTLDGVQKKAIEVPANEWASVLASVCLRGEDGATHAEALAYHGDGLL